MQLTESDCYNVVTGSLRVGSPFEFVRACLDCSASHVELDARAKQKTHGCTVEGALARLAGFLQYRLDNDGEDALVFDADLVHLVQSKRSLNLPQQLLRRLKTVMKKAFGIRINGADTDSFSGVLWCLVFVWSSL